MYIYILYVYIYVYMYMYICICMYMYIYICIYIYTYKLCMIVYVNFPSWLELKPNKTTDHCSSKFHTSAAQVISCRSLGSPYLMVGYPLTPTCRAPWRTLSQKKQVTSASQPATSYELGLRGAKTSKT